jgi:1,4-alpha-glucan branching enzyme
MGANLVDGGATFRCWAPAAQRVHVRLNAGPNWVAEDSNLLVLDPPSGTWAGFVPGVKEGDPYRFHVVGSGTEGPKRDPYARELGPGFPDCEGLVRTPSAYPWHDSGFRAPAFNDLIVYQFHVGVFYAADAQGNDQRLTRDGTFLDVLGRIPYLRDLGVNAIQPLPVVEFETTHSLGYNGSDYFSPEDRYAVAPGDLGPYLATLNGLLAARGLAPVGPDVLAGAANQFRALIDVAHLHGLAVILDVVYNHAGGWEVDGHFDDQTLYFFDRQPYGDNNRSLYFTDQGWAGGLVFAFWNQGVRQFLIDNARSYFDEYHVDGFRYDEVTVIDRFGGWGFCQDLTDTLHFRKPAAIHVAEYWNPDPSWVIKPTSEGGAGFDAVWSDRLRGAVRGAIAQAAGGRNAQVVLDPIAQMLTTPPGFSAQWRAVQHLENHDTVYAGHADRVPRVPALADSTDARSWYARSRARVANGLLLTAPGIPMLFMGQEFLEEKPWSDTPDPGTLIGWAGLAPDPNQGGRPHDKAMADHLRFTQDLAWLRRRQPALRGEPIHVFHVHNDNRVLAFHRWLDGVGRDVVVVASLNEATFYGYGLGFPGPGTWLEVFNGDVYDNYVNPAVAGNGGSVSADGPPMHDLPCSATIVIPANGLLVFARDAGD